MRTILNLSAREIVAGVARRDMSAESVIRAYIDRIEAVEPRVGAWQYFDPQLVIRRARALDQHPMNAPLLAIPVGVKDLMDTADMPTSYGSAIYSEHRPSLDAACVAACRAAGAVIMGKTVTTEFATFQPGLTRNPKAPVSSPRTPGGSSSGSAAAVAAGMVPIAFGTQTAGSIVRPAAYCGVVGYKPTYGFLPLAGVKPLSPSLDTIGVMTKSVDDAAFFVGALARIELPLSCPSSLRIGLCRTPHWERASDDARRVLEDTVRLFEKCGGKVVDVDLPASWNGLVQAQMDIMGHEAYAAFAPERQQHSEHFSPAFSKFLAAGSAVDGARLTSAHLLADKARCALDTIFKSVDVLIAPSAEGEAPAGLSATGDPIFSRLWTLLGVPCVHVPMDVGAYGMPIGVTVIGPRWGDSLALSAADLLQRNSTYQPTGE